MLIAGRPDNFPMALTGTRSTWGAFGAGGPTALVWRKEMTMAKTRLIGRSAITGRFKSVPAARRQKNTSVVERIKVTKKRGR